MYPLKILKNGHIVVPRIHFDTPKLRVYFVRFKDGPGPSRSAFPALSCPKARLRDDARRVEEGSRGARVDAIINNRIDDVLKEVFAQLRQATWGSLGRIHRGACAA